jgi:hypothetical protein
MSNYEIKLPDGRTISVDAPDEAGARQAATNFMMREPAKKAGEAGGLDNFTNSMAQGMTAGLFDEAVAAGDAAVGPPVDWALGKLGLGSTNTSTAPSFAQRYDQNLAVNRAQAQGYADTHPVADTAGKVAGAVATLPLLPKWLLGGKGLVGGTLKAAGTGAGFGAATGFGEGEGGFENRAINAGKDAVIGGAVGGALHPLAMGAGALGNMIAESGPGRYVANKLGSGVNMMADAFDRMAPKTTPNSLSAAAPEGGQLPVSGFMADTADALRSSAPSADKTLEEAAARRIANAAMRGEAPGFSVPGFNLKLADLGEGAMPADLNPMTQRLAQTAYISPGGAPKVINEALDARNIGAPGRFKASMGPEANVPEIADAQRYLNLNRQKVGEDAYAEMRRRFAIDEPVLKDSPALTTMMENPAVQDAIDRVTKAEVASRVGRPNARPASEIEVMHEVKRAIQEMGLDPTGRPAPGAFWWNNLANDFVSELKKANPKLADADVKYRQASSLFSSRNPEDSILTRGQNFMRAGTSEGATEASPAALAADLPKYDPMQLQTFKVGATNTLKDVADAGPDATRSLGKKIMNNDLLRRKLQEIYGPGRFAEMEKAAKAEKTFAGTDRVIRGGSDSMQKAASAADEALSGHMPTSTHGFVNSALGKVAEIYNRGRAGNESVREQIAKQLTSMDPVANAELLARIQRILAEGNNPRMIQRGLSFGATQRPE